MTMMDGMGSMTWRTTSTSTISLLRKKGSAWRCSSQRKPCMTSFGLRNPTSVVETITAKERHLTNENQK